MTLLKENRAFPMELAKEQLLSAAESRKAVQTSSLRSSLLDAQSYNKERSTLTQRHKSAVARRLYLKSLLRAPYDERQNQTYRNIQRAEENSVARSLSPNFTRTRNFEDAFTSGGPETVAGSSSVRTRSVSPTKNQLNKQSRIQSEIARLKDQILDVRRQLQEYDEGTRSRSRSRDRPRSKSRSKSPVEEGYRKFTSGIQLV